MSLNVYGTIPKRTVASRTLDFPTNKRFGLRFFPGEGDNGAVFNQNAGRDQIQDGLDQLFGTTGGERLMMPEFGLDVAKYLFDPLDEETVYQIKVDVKNQLDTYFSDLVEILNITVRLTDKGKYQGMPAILVILSLRVIETQDTIDFTGEL